MLWITIKHVQRLLARNISKLSATICGYWGKHKLHHFKSSFQTFWDNSIFFRCKFTCCTTLDFSVFHKKMIH